MSIYMSRAELNEISEGLITAYANKFNNRVIQSVDIEHFITEFLKLKIEYTSFAEDDVGKIGFLADGETPLLIHQNGKIVPFVFMKDTIVLNELQRIKAGSKVNDELLDLIEIIADVLGGLKEVSE